VSLRSAEKFAFRLLSQLLFSMSAARARARLILFRSPCRGGAANRKWRNSQPSVIQRCWIRSIRLAREAEPAESTIHRQTYDEVDLPARSLLLLLPSRFPIARRAIGKGILKRTKFGRLISEFLASQFLYSPNNPSLGPVGRARISSS